MGLVLSHVHKARKPTWVDFKPRASMRTAYDIAARFEKKFAQAFMRAIKESLPEKLPRAVLYAWEKNSLADVLAALPLPSPMSTASPEQQLAWKTFYDKIKDAYLAVIRESGEDAARDLNERLNLNIKITHDEMPDVIEALKAKKKKEPRLLPTMLPINTHAERWVNERAMQLVTQGITTTQLETAKQIIQDNFSRGMRAEKMYSDLKANIGLTAREAKAVSARRALHTGAGLSESQVDKLTAKYADTLLGKRAERIARTETVFAQAEGRRELWQEISRSGNMPPVKREWISAPGSDNPARPCEICSELNGAQADVDGMYDSIDGPIQGPPAHPECRCGETLVRVENE